MTLEKLSRQELYDQVWATPISRLAHHYGISDVALAKTCKRLGVPRPGRGYWARLAAGEKLMRTPLPTFEGDTWVTLERVENPVPKAARPDVPSVQVPTDLRRAEDVTKRIGLVLGSSKPDRHGKLVVGTLREPVFAVSLSAHRRALLLLDAFAKACALRGHEVKATSVEDTWSLEVAIAGECVAFSIIEQLEQREHVLTAAERVRKTEGSDWGIPKFDQVCAGELHLVFNNAGSGRKKWSDTRTKSLESQLGAIVVAAEAEVQLRWDRAAAAERQRQREEEVRQDRLRREEEARLAQVERDRLKQIEEDRAKYRQALVRDLRDMAQEWADARQVRQFLRAYQAAIPPGERSEGVTAWLAWARATVNAHDPLCNLKSIPKKLQPDIVDPS